MPQLQLESTLPANIAEFLNLPKMHHILFPWSSGSLLAGSGVNLTTVKSLVGRKSITVEENYLYKRFVTKQKKITNNIAP